MGGGNWLPVYKWEEGTTLKSVNQPSANLEIPLEKVSSTHPPYVWVNSRSNMPMFCPKKLISQPRGVQNPPFLIQMMLTHYTLRSVLFRPHQTPRICLKMPKCAIFITF